MLTMLVAFLQILCLAVLSNAATFSSAGPLTATSASKTIATISTTFATISHPAGATATDIRGDIGFSFIEQPIDIPNLPPHVNLTCKNCTTHGTLELATGGYSNDDGVSIPAEILANGFLEFVAHDVSANFTIELALSPGFAVADFRIPLYSVKLFKIDLGSGNSFDIGFDIYIPLSLLLNSEVDLYPSLTLEVPENSTLFLDIGLGDWDRSYSTGFNETKIVPSLNINAPGLSFNLSTGLDFVLSAEASVNDGMAFPANVTLGGNANVSLGLPVVSMSVAELHHVNGTCDQPQGSETVYDSAVNINYQAGVDLEFSAGLFADTGLVGNAAVETDPFGFNYSVPLPSSCLKFDPVASGLIAATASPLAASSNKQSGTAGPLTPSVLVSLVTLIAVALGMAVL